ncbi:nucleotidyl transferase AbiEii/AbiGii toxin family protein [Fervidobacterium thailandense]|uniref:nucleotidyl transferase AbiEii/AbiGii toxin family protein n=1 Tax=Fervidobacterium thailandense TaxID=1008305 RepID=UPI001F4E930D|nr:nucleotidyl transferase AbiEii/AbiGii toxin family protein [Fervidobacterium thailandense]
MNLRERLLKTLENLSKLEIFRDFYLAGGTALFLKYEHRPSYDLDFFLLPDKSFSNIYESTLRNYDVEFSYVDSSTIIFFLNGVKVSLFEYKYPLIGITSKIGGIVLCSDEDIACMKMIAISQRGLKKDFYDLWFLIKKYNWSLENLVSMLRKKYEKYNPMIFLRALVYFEDAEKNKDIEEVEKSWEEIKSFFVNLISTL